MRMRTSWVTLGIVAVAALAISSAQTDNPRVGSWELNVAKSKYSPGPAPKSHQLKIEAAGQAEKVTSEQVAADGTKLVVEYMAEYDGKPHPIKGSPTADTVTLKRVDAHTSERVDSKAGKTVTTYQRVVSKDGKTMTVTIKGVDVKGQSVNNVVLFEKK